VSRPSPQSLDTEGLINHDRCDLWIAILTQSTTVFFQQPREPFVEYPRNLLSSLDKRMLSQPDPTKDLIRDRDLAQAWSNMRAFCQVANIAACTKQLVGSDLIFETMTAIMYRLLHLRFSSESLDEAIRLGLLAYSHHVFLQWLDMDLSESAFAQLYKTALSRLLNVRGATMELSFWMSMVGSISLYEASTEWLRHLMQEHAKVYEVSGWTAAQTVLKKFMWITILDEEAGKRVWEVINNTHDNLRHLSLSAYKEKPEQRM
jgi:hypothetical protein